MDRLKILSFILMIFFGYIAYLVKYPALNNLCDVRNVPYCFGRDICEDFYANKIITEYKSFSNFFYNIFSVKNVYFANYNGVSVVVKQLQVPHAENRNFDLVVSEDNLVLSDLKICSNQTYKKLLKEFEGKEATEQLFSKLRDNAEPVLLTLFSSENNWPVPYFYGCCGQLFVEANSGRPLNDFQNSPWIDRAHIAKQLLEAAFKFTSGHREYKFYLTDISPDNIAVNENLTITFVDLENGILGENYNDGTVHKTHHFPEEHSYIFSEQDICSSAISDHNIYSVCKLLLSKETPWPMMQGGLLHSPPRKIVENYRTLFSNIELCVVSSTKDRFDIGSEIVHTLSEILNKSVHN